MNFSEISFPKDGLGGN
uniref:Uncharacterized protein n=1 Tax=Arundo donax TaxID=35708 RepID=A0A0A9A0S6_ARUDO